MADMPRFTSYVRIWTYDEHRGKAGWGYIATDPAKLRFPDCTVLYRRVDGPGQKVTYEPIPGTAISGGIDVSDAVNSWENASEALFERLRASGEAGNGVYKACLEPLRMHDLLSAAARGDAVALDDAVKHVARLLLERLPAFAEQYASSSEKTRELSRSLSAVTEASFEIYQSWTHVAFMVKQHADAVSRLRADLDQVKTVMREDCDDLERRRQSFLNDPVVTRAEELFSPDVTGVFYRLHYRKRLGEESEALQRFANEAVSVLRVLDERREHARHAWSKARDFIASAPSARVGAIQELMSAYAKDRSALLKYEEQFKDSGKRPYDIEDPTSPRKARYITREEYEAALAFARNAETHPKKLEQDFVFEIRRLNALLGEDPVYRPGLVKELEKGRAELAKYLSE